MELNAENFKSLFPELKNIDEKRIKLFISLNSEKISKNYFGKDFELAVFNLSAHQMLCADGGSSSNKGAKISENIGGVATQTYQPLLLNNSDSFYASTGYGIEYLRLRKEHATMGWFVT
ncbi:MAG: DUF4054 domain-containing protein [Silvanigrellaceae bacterium]|nr:DUF4054 domain-containing protein [Silvanigrellaceae bacterium]